MNMYRMPTAFGRSPGPRSDLSGNRFDWSQARRTGVKWLCEFDAAKAASMLPRRCELRQGALAQLEFQKLEYLPWLAGRGYTLFSAKLPVRFKESAGSWRDMMYLLVMFENRADPIITGREELGFAKVYAELDWQFRAEVPAAGKASWDGTVFFQFELGHAAPAQPAATAPAMDLLHHRYVPAIGNWGQPALDEFACSPAAAPAAAPLLAMEQQIDFSFFVRPWEELPTLSHIARGLAELAFPTRAAARVERFAGGADHFGQHVLE